MRTAFAFVRFAVRFRARGADALLAVKHRFSTYLQPEENEDPKFRAIAWQSLLWAIWGQAAENSGKKIIKSAPVHLRERYEQIFNRGVDTP